MVTSPKPVWAENLSLALKIWAQDNGYTQLWRLRDELALSEPVWRRISAGNAIITSSDPTAYAKLYLRTGIPEADPRTVPPRKKISGPSSTVTFTPRAWTEEQWLQWQKTGEARRIEKLSTLQPEHNPADNSIDSRPSLGKEAAPIPGMQENQITSRRRRRIPVKTSAEEVQFAATESPVGTQPDEAVQDHEATPAPQEPKATSQPIPELPQSTITQGQTIGGLVDHFIGLAASQFVGLAASQLLEPIEARFSINETLMRSLAEAIIAHTQGGGGVQNSSKSIDGLARQLIELLRPALRGSPADRDHIQEQHRAILTELVQTADPFTRDRERRERSIQQSVDMEVKL